MEDFTGKALLLLIGFALTTLGGGLLGYYLQNRTWKHQNEAKLRDTEREAATTIFENVSSLMDKRLYRMRQLNWKLTDNASDKDLIEEHMVIYRQMLYDWNDNLNRNLALTQRYFGMDVRHYLENTIYEEFKRIGSLLESAYVKRKTGTVSSPINVSGNIDTLRDHIYRLNVRMIALIQSGKVGIFHPDSDKSHESPSKPLLHRGYKGPEVYELQARLKELGHYGGSIDGNFDAETEKAVQLFQRSCGLTADGKVGPETRRELNTTST
jgi:Putative peptidoglycan binding domain